MREADLQARIMVALSQAGCLVFRNNTGALPDRRGIPVRFGLCRGSSDVIGLCPDGRFLAVEVKTERGLPTDAQLHFIEAIRRAGGRAGIARSPEQAVRIALDGEPRQR